MTVPEIDVVEAARRRAEGCPVIDVREVHEYVEAHVPGAVLIPLGEVVERSDEVTATGQVLIICLRTLGIDAVNVAGGTMAWIEAGHPVVVGEDPGL